jgi:DNA-binding SARP family transcriptional activator
LVAKTGKDLRSHHAKGNQIMTTTSPALLQQCRALCRAGQVAAAFELAQQALTRARKDENPLAIAEALIAQAHVHFRLGHYQQAQTLLHQATAQVASDHPLQVETLIHLGMCAAETNAPQQAEAYYRRAVDLSRLLGYEEALYRGLHAIAVGVYFPRGQFDLALAMDREAYDFIVARGKPRLGWNALAAMGWVLHTIARTQEARQMAAMLAEVAPADSLPRGFLDALLADLAQDEGRMEEAATLYANACTIASIIGDPGLNVLVRLGLSRLHCRLNAPATAWGWADEALTQAKQVGYVHLVGMALLARARASQAGGDVQASEQDLHSAIAMMTPLQFNYHLAEAWLLLAGLLQQSGRDAQKAWTEASDRIRRGNYHFLLERERKLAFALIMPRLRQGPAQAQLVAQDMLQRLLATPPQPLRIDTLGRFEVWQGSRHIDHRAWGRRRAGMLFKLLLISPRHTRTQEQVIEAFWPDKTTTAAQPLLHQATSALRRVLEPELPRGLPSRYLTVEEDCLTLHLPPGSWVAHEAFVDWARQGAFEQALAIYHGPLFAQEPYADWAIWERERLAQHYLRVLLGASEQALSDNRPQDALMLARKALVLEPWQEQATRFGMEAYLALNDRAGALRLYRTLAKRLQEELGIEPDETLQAFYRQIAEK